MNTITMEPEVERISLKCCSDWLEAAAGNLREAARLLKGTHFDGAAQSELEGQAEIAESLALRYFEAYLSVRERG